MDVPFQALIDRLDRLSAQFDDLRRLIRKAVRLADDDPEMALTRIRKVLEYVVHDAFERLVKEPPGTRPLENLLQRFVKDGHLPLHLAPHATSIRELGNAGTHRGEGHYKMRDVSVAMFQLDAILDWYFEKVRPDAAFAPASPDPSPAADGPPRPAAPEPGTERAATAPPTPDTKPAGPTAPPREISNTVREVMQQVAALAGPTAPPREISNSIGMKLVLIPAGEFMMGSDETDPDAQDDEVVVDAAGKKQKHRVRITRPFYLGATEVTRGQFRRFVDEDGYRTEAEKGGKGGWGWNEAAGKFEQDRRYTWRDTGFEQTDEHPVVNVSWYDVVAFCRWLSHKEGAAYRLPTEAEWEYACRAGTTSRYSSGDDPEGLAAVGNIADGTAKAKHPEWTWAIAARDGFVYTAPVGRYNPNAWDLFDMHGNVWEWCSDGYAADYYKRSPVDDPPGFEGAELCVIRGGAWRSEPRLARSAIRRRIAPEVRNYGLGFRPARDQSVR